MRLSNFTVEILTVAESIYEASSDPPPKKSSPMRDESAPQEKHRKSTTIHKF
jgi:hypothetical protein